MEINDRILGKRIKEIRQQRGLSQETLAALADVSPQYISILENGNKSASLKVIVNIAEGLEISVDELLTGNQKHNDLEYISDLGQLFADCTRYEKQVLYEQMQSLMAILRNNRDLL